MTLELDAAFLAGFITGTYDLKGEQQLPAYIKPFIDRCLTSGFPPSNDAKKEEVCSIKPSKSAIPNHVDDKRVANIQPADARNLAVAIVKASEEETRCNGGDDDQFRDSAEMVAHDTDAATDTETYHSASSLDMVRPRRFTSLTDEEKADIQKKIADNFSLSEIGKPYGIAYATMYSWALKLRIR